MSASPGLRYARQYTLAEIGTTGQARIEASQVQAGGGDPRATEIALDYIVRAGARLLASGEPVSVPSSETVAVIAGRPELREAAAFLAGALSATEHLARIAGVAAAPIVRVPTLWP
jgi:hypothetical protein